jgi:tol-pal system protein YbgF
MTSLNRKKCLLLLVSALLITGCQDVLQQGDQSAGAPGTAAPRPPAISSAPEIDRRLRADVTSLGQSLKAIRRGLSNQEARIERVRRGFQSLEGSLEKNRAGIEKLSKQISDQMKELRGRLDTMESDISFLRSPVGREESSSEKEEFDLEIRAAGAPARDPSGEALPPVGGSSEDAIGAGVPQQSLVVAGVPAGASAEVSVLISPAGSPVIAGQSGQPAQPDPAAEYNEALRIFNEEKIFPKARLLFNRFISRNPIHELADDAQYWIGESYFEEKNFERAILAFNKVQVDYANGDKAPDALLKEALAFLNLGDKASARELMGRVVQKYPDSAAAAKATERLKSL